MTYKEAYEQMLQSIKIRTALEEYRSDPGVLQLSTIRDIRSLLIKYEEILDDKLSEEIDFD